MDKNYYDDEVPPVKLFDVTCVIGSVYQGEMLDGLTPMEAAYTLVARHNAEGIYTFPHDNPDVGTVTLSVTFPGRR